MCLLNLLHVKKCLNRFRVEEQALLIMELIMTSRLLGSIMLTCWLKLTKTQMAVRGFQGTWIRTPLAT